MATEKAPQSTLKNLWTIATISSAIDKDNNTLSLFDILEELTLQVSGSMPERTVIPVNHHLLSLWEREETGTPLTLKFKVVLRDPIGNILHENQAEVVMQAPHKRARFRAQFNGFPVSVPGIYRYEIVSLEPEKTGAEILGGVAIEVKVARQPIKSPYSPS
ncbi:MAG: hypothetical protein B7X04_02255 [Parcubacteria group bacterium 21-54-25]|nr:MAG: hypothetical protein B7X04_02255 [Parcubacteria group bacterium 21-54-25]HQU07870.1 hypothetical protein [Candidatus Paceibacterota bacterium]